MSVPGEVLCSRRVLVLLVTFDLWLSLCVGLLFFVCVFVRVFLFVLFFFFVIVVVLLLLACWTWVGLGSQAGLTPLEYGRLPAGSHSALVHSSATGSLLSLGFACGSRAWVGRVAESVKLGVVLGPHAASTSTTFGPGWWHCRDQGVTVGAHRAASYLSLAVFLLASALFL